VETASDTCASNNKRQKTDKEGGFYKETGDGRQGKGSD
jgi:hypothetical protein